MQEKKDVLAKVPAVNRQPTNTEVEVRNDNIPKPSAVPPPKPRQRRIGDIIAFDGQLYTVYWIKGDGRKVGLRRMNEEEVKKFLIQRRRAEEAAIRKAKEIYEQEKGNPKRVIDVPVEKPKKEEPKK